MNSRYPLHTYVNRILLIRLLIMTALVAVILGTATWWHERRQAEARVVEVTTDRLAVIRGEFGLMLARGLDKVQAFGAAMDAVGQMEFDWSHGRFAYAVFYNDEGDFHVFRARDHAASASAEALIGDDRSQRPELGSVIQKMIKLDGRPAVRVVVPIAGLDGKLAAWLTGVYVLSPTAASRLAREPWITVAFVLAIVLVTAGLLYPIILRLARRLAGFSGDLLEANLEMMEVLGCAVAKRDSDTDAHNYRVSIYAVRLAEKEGLSAGTIQSLIKGAFLHDVGKIGIRDDVLLKPGKLTDDEYAVMKTHVDHGLDIVGRARWLQDALAVVGGHHEKFDGGGYPERVPGEVIPTSARIFAITDVFDALASERPYKDALPLEKVTAILLEGSGTHFDPDLLRSFLQIAPELHGRLNGQDTDTLREELREIIRTYFNTGLETLMA